MSILQEKLANGHFAITAEMAPPKGCDFTEQLEVAELLKGKVDAVNVTDMQSACLKASSLGLCIKLQQAGIDAIVQMTGRDRNRMAIMGDVLSASAFGINTVLALTGDHPTVGDCKQAQPVYDLDSVGILKMLSEMEASGTDCGGNALSSTPKLFKGAVVTPVYDPLPLQISKLKKKVAAGAQFIQTQGIFDMESLKNFMQQVRAAGITVPIMAGIIPLKTAGMAKFMNANVPGIQVPDWMIERLEAAAAEGKEKGIKGLPMQAGIDMAAEFIAQIKAENVCEGVHIMAIGAEQNVPEILKRAGI